MYMIISFCEFSIGESFREIATTGGSHAVRRLSNMATSNTFSTAHDAFALVEECDCDHAKLI
jgi:hypothetical protein